MDRDRMSITITDDEIWEQRRSRLKALESVDGTHLQAELKYRVYLPLFDAVREGNVDKFIEALEKCSAEKRVSLPDIIDIEAPSRNSLLHVAAGIEKADILRALIDVIPDKGLAVKVNYQGDTALHIAARAGRIRTAELILDRSSIEDKANDMGNTALHEAVKNRHSELTSMLLSKNPTLVYKQNKESKCPLYLAVEMGNLEILRLLMEAVDGHEVLPSQIEGMSPVHGAVIHQRIEILKEMSKHKKELFYIRDAGGGTPLHLAASVNYIDGVKFLVNEFNLSAFEFDEEGYLPIHVACKMGYLEIIKKLLELWPNPDELLTLKEGQNIVHVAAKYGEWVVVDYIRRDPEFQRLVNAKDKGGNTPLHLAALQLESFVLWSLVAADVVDLALVNNGNLTAYDIAEEQLKKIDAPRKAFQQFAIPILKAVKAPRSKDKAICRRKGADPGVDVAPLNLDRLKVETNARMVVATLVATVTFAAGFSVPGGYNNSEPDVGMATLLNKPMYDVFVICNTVAMYSSIIAVVILLKAQPSEFQPAHYFLRKARLPLLISICTMSVAFMAGVYVTVSKRIWVAVVTLIIGITAFFHILTFYSYMFAWPFFHILKLTAPLLRRLTS